MTDAAAGDWKQVRALYRSAFPKEERPPFFLAKRRVRQGRARLLVARDRGAFVGFVYLLCASDAVYIFLFAVDDARRRMGYGSEILRMIVERYAGRRIFLAREQLDRRASNFAQRIQRRAFYAKNGFADLPGRIEEAGVQYDIMGVGGGVRACEYDELTRAWAGTLLHRLIGMRMLE